MRLLKLGIEQQQLQLLPKIGDAHQGGIICHIWQPGQWGYEAGKFKGIVCAVNFVAKTHAPRVNLPPPDHLEGHGEGRNNLLKTVAWFDQHSITHNSFVYDVLDLNIDGYDDWFVGTLADTEMYWQNIHLFIDKVNHDQSATSYNVNSSELVLVATTMHTRVFLGDLITGDYSVSRYYADTSIRPIPIRYFEGI